MKVLAFGFLRLKPDEFWEMTYEELCDMVMAFQKVEEYEFRKLYRFGAWHAANVMSVHTKKPVKPEKLFNEEKLDRELAKKRNPQVTEEERRKALEMAKERGVNVGPGESSDREDCSQRQGI